MQIKNKGKENLSIKTGPFIYGSNNQGVFMNVDDVHYAKKVETSSRITDFNIINSIDNVKTFKYRDILFKKYGIKIDANEVFGINNVAERQKKEASGVDQYQKLEDLLDKMSKKEIKIKNKCKVIIESKNASTN